MSITNRVAILTRSKHESYDLKPPTIGVLQVGWHPWITLFTLELPYIGNKKFISCIPEGSYWVTPYLSKRHGKCFKVEGVPERTDILFHPFNHVEETKGCIGVGCGMQDVRSGLHIGRMMLTSSKNAMWRLIGDDWSGFRLDIV